MDGFSANLPPYLSVRKRYRRQCGITTFYSPITHFTGRHFYQTFREAHKRFKALGLRVKVLQISFSRTQSAISVWRSMPLHCLHWEQHDWVCAVIHLKKMLDENKGELSWNNWWQAGNGPSKTQMGFSNFSLHLRKGRENELSTLKLNVNESSTFCLLR